MTEVIIRRTVRGDWPSATVGGMIYHVLNRANGRLPLFETPADYQAFEKVLGEGHDRFPRRTVAYCLMPNRLFSAKRPSSKIRDAKNNEVAFADGRELEATLRPRGRPKSTTGS
ncbi:MAG: hypothetical protein P0120_14345 [Nitrospira sp.]|nr:hypothetical protein [Nitrospira sp.]